MASSRLREREVSAAAKLGFCPHKHSLLIIIGRTARLSRTQLISRELEAGIRSWDIDLKSCNLNAFLQEFLSHHTASFKGAGQKCLRHSTKALDTQVLISPSQESAHSEVFALLSQESSHKLLILAGLSVEDSGDLLFNKGLFSPEHLRQILSKQFEDNESSASCLHLTKTHLTLSCPNTRQWRKTLLENTPLQGPFSLQINPPEVLPAMQSLGEFMSLISGTICPASPFDLLPPPTTVGFLKLSRPCCYVFPAGRGDCAFFAINGFTVLVDGGSDSQACFWKLVRHLDRVDAVLLTHISTDNLPGVISFLERKVAEKELSSDIKDDLSKKLISPELGVVFLNAPSRLQEYQTSCEENVLRTNQQGAVTLQLLKKLDIKPHPMFRPQGVPIKPLTLFQKMGVGQLDLYILSPGKTSQEYETFMQNWPDRTIPLSKSQSLPLATLASVSALLVWHPACPQEKVVRVLFPGVTPQAKLLQGLEKLKGLDFLQKPTVTTGDLERLGQDRKVKRTDSLDSGRSQRKEGSPKYVKERGVKEEGKEKGKTLIGVGGRDMDKAKVKETSLKHKASFSEKNSSKKGVGRVGKNEEKTGDKEENSSKSNEQIKRNGVSSKAKSENKTKPKKDAKNDSKMGENKSQKVPGNEANNSKKVHGNTELPNNKSMKQKTVEAETLSKEKENQKREPENHCGSKMSTPEDMTEDFLRLRQESGQEEGQVERADKEKQRSSELGTVKRLGDLSEESRSKTADRSEEKVAGGSGLMEVESIVNLMQHVPGGGKKAESDPKKNLSDEPVKSSRPVKVVGFPSPLNKASKMECTVQLDITPTEYTLLDGALRNTPPSQASPENQAPNSPDEETVEPVSPDTRPNSAGHTPYCLSPDDVWCNRTALSRLQAQGNPDSADAYDPDGSSRQSDEPKGVSENCTNSKEKHLSFLSLGAFKDGSSEPSPSVTTTTTHSLPAEVSSPQSTEVDESLSMSFEQGPTTVSQREGDSSVYQSHSNGGYFVGIPLSVKKPPRSLGHSSDMGKPFAPNTLHFEGSAHDVDLCLVSPCEFKHFKQPDSSSGTSDSSKGVFASNHHGNNNNPKDRSPSESNAPACTEDCPSTTADGVLDSDSDESCSDPSNSPCDHNSSQALPPDPLPAPLRDSPPLPPHPDTSMPVPQSDSEAHGKRTKATGGRFKNMSAVIDSSPVKSGSVKNRPVSQSGVIKGNLTRTPSSSTRSAPAKSTPAPGSKATSASEVGVYVDLAYIPSGSSSPTVTVDFFRCIRSSCYIISGNSPEREEMMRQTLDALLDGKTSWPDTMQVTVIPTFESVLMQEWYQQTLDRQRELSITVLGSNSTVAMQDETFPACKIEF